MSVVSFLRGSRRRYDEPRYVLVVCLCAALIFAFLAAFSAPMTDAIYLVKLTVQPDDLYDSNVVVLLGILGYCWKRSGVEACSRVSAGYQLGSELSAPIPATLPLIPTWSTTVLSLQVATFGVTFIVCAIVVSAHFVHTYLARWALVYCGIAAVLQLACYAFDLALFSVTRSAINRSSTIKLGNGTWLAMVAFILLACAIVGDCVQTRRWTTSRRRAPRDTPIITPYTVSEEELGKQDDPTSRDQDVLSLIPANERRSLDQPTIDIIYHSLFEETAPTTSPATTSELGTAVKASPVSPVIDYGDPYKLHSAESGQLTPKIKPIAGPNPSFPNKATTLPDVVVTRQVPLGPREARKVPGSRTTLQPLAPIRRKVTTTRYAPSSYYTYQSGTTSDSDQTISPTTFFPRSSTHGVFSRPTTMHSGVLPPMSERDVSTPSITTQHSEDFQLLQLAYSVGSTSTLSSTWNSVFQKLAPGNPQTPPMPHFPISSHRFGGDRFVEGRSGTLSDADTWSAHSAVQSSDLEHSTDLQHVSGLVDYPILLDARQSGQDRELRRLV